MQDAEWGMLTMRVRLPLVIPPAHEAALLNMRAQIDDAQAMLNDVQQVLTELDEAIRTSSEIQLKAHGIHQHFADLHELYTAQAAALEGQRAVYTSYISTSILGGLHRSLEQHGAAFSCPEHGQPLRVLALTTVGSEAPEDTRELEVEIGLCCPEHLGLGSAFIQAVGESLEEPVRGPLV